MRDAQLVFECLFVLLAFRFVDAVDRRPNQFRWPWTVCKALSKCSSRDKFGFNVFEGRFLLEGAAEVVR